MFNIANRKLYSVTKDSSDGKIKKGDKVYRNIYTKEIIAENEIYLHEYDESELVLDFEADDISDQYDFFSLGYCKKCEWFVKGSIKRTIESVEDDIDDI